MSGWQTAAAEANTLLNVSILRIAEYLRGCLWVGITTGSLMQMSLFTSALIRKSVKNKLRGASFKKKHQRGTGNFVAPTCDW